MHPWINDLKVFWMAGCWEALEILGQGTNLVFETAHCTPTEPRCLDSRWQHHSWRSLHQTNIAIEVNGDLPFFSRNTTHWIKLLDYSWFFECNVNCTSCHISRGYIDSDCQPLTGFRSDWWKDLRLWRCRPQVVTSMFPGCFNYLSGFLTTYLTVLNMFKSWQTQRIWCGEPTSWGSQTLRNLLRLMQQKSDKILVWLIEDVSTWNWCFRIFWQLWKLRNAGTCQQRALDLLHSHLD